MMKRIIGLSLLCMATYSVRAQVATLSSNKVRESIPQLLKADTMIMQKQQQLSSAFGQKRYVAQVQLGIADSLYRLQPKAEATQKAIATAQKLSEELQQFEQQANKELEDYRNVLLTPYGMMIDAAIKTVAQRRKIMVVTSVSNVLYGAPEADITEEVIKELQHQKN